MLGVGLVGYLFQPIGALRRALFILSAVGLFIPFLPSGPFAVLTWVSNGIGLVLAISLVVAEWLLRKHGKAISSHVGVNAPVS